MDGICTLANDRVYNQLVALLNSIEAVLGKGTPICVYPYDDNTQQVAAEVARRPNVHLYNDKASMQRWDEFAQQAWDTHPTAQQRWQQNGNATSYYRFGTHRRYCAFDGIFERFLYMDADTLLLGQVAPLFQQLKEHDCVVYDFQHTDPTHVYDCSASGIELFSPKRLQSEIFCSGFYASKKGLFDEEKQSWLLSKLEAGEAQVLYLMAPDQTLLNYMMMRSGFSIYNFALHLPVEARTGCCVTSPHFEEKNHLLYDKGKPLTYLHYIGIKSQFFNRVCAGENIDFPYRDLFLYYRYLHEPEKRPQFTTQPVPYNQSPSWMTKLLRKSGLTR